MKVRSVFERRLREEVFVRTQAEWARRIAGRPLQRYRGFSQQPLNNAVLMHYIVYMKDLDLFESVYELCGRNLVRTIATIRKVARAGGEPFEALRSWLLKSQAVHSPGSLPLSVTGH